MTAPSIKEALEAVEPYLDAITCYASTINEHEGNRVAKMVRSALATLSPPAGERRGAIARILEPQAWAALGIGDTLAYKNRRTSSLRKTDRILASGLVQDEAAIRADEREKCAKICDDEFTKLRATWRSMDAGPERAAVAAQAQLARDIAANIRSARDGGAES